MLIVNFMGVACEFRGLTQAAPEIRGDEALRSQPTRHMGTNAVGV